MRRQIATSLSADAEGPAIHKSLSQFMEDKSMRIEMPE